MTKRKVSLQVSLKATLLMLYMFEHFFLCLVLMIAGTLRRITTKMGFKCAVRTAVLLSVGRKRSLHLFCLVNH